MYLYVPSEVRNYTRYPLLRRLELHMKHYCTILQTHLPVLVTLLGLL